MNLRHYRADALMLITALIWGSTFVAQRLGMDHIGPFLYTGLRFAIGAITLLPLIWLLRKPAQAGKRPSRLSRPMLLGSLVLGLVLTLGINLQQIGLMFTTVTNSGFITGLYVILVPVFGLFIGMRTHKGTWAGAVMALVGMVLLSVTAEFTVARGDWLQLVGACFWAVHVLLVGALASRYDPILVSFIQFLVCAVVSLTLAVALEPINFAAIAQALPAILYGGILAVGVAFTLQVVAQKDAITSHAAIILSLEAVFAALAGWLILGETLTPRGLLGCALMLAGMLTAQLVPIYLDRRRRPAVVQQEPAGHH
ncbi:MAG TPA: EamA family transporter [Pseudomonas sp.]|nr:EamA family transporter [Pseudomonas sp.]MAQ51867.1 EamA family transporter [Pseudomonas sp.]MBB50227.1 EamA family transporter [Pseudomonadales bacterium]MBB50525.1 EamA family transporter [Pseudomonadales bacterium]HCA25284.1 EamA family transporter [Pseudomonas sp.]|tara:strand:+ start:478 stop:1413 length:936 start_codon:yes stop_codon:yes gene_type:complete